MDIVVVGDLNVDLVMTGLAALPAYGELSLAKSMRFVLGGSSAIFACNIARLGASVGFVGKLGADELGYFLKRRLEESRVDTSRIVMDPAQTTGICISMSFPQEYAQVTYPGARNAFALSDVDLDYVKSARHLHMSGFYLMPSMRQDTPRLFRLAREAGLSTSLDPDNDPSGKWNGGMRELLPYVDYFLPNEHEALSIAGAADLGSAAGRLSGLAKTTIVKCGPQGALAITGGNTVAAAAFPVTPIDTTGAGDSFNAGFLFQQLQGASLEQSLRWGNACGALSTQTLGGTEGFPRCAEVEQFLTRA
jgi:sugar/nucleoside kinase (ribokinase family)